jgi:hypothetical protein
MIGVKILRNKIDISPIFIEFPHGYGKMLLEMWVSENYIPI